ncbi:MAG: type II toxin-antitoxin system VapC family toxin [Thermoplasmatota archaeon]
MIVIKYLVDTGFFVAFLNEDDRHHGDAQRIFSECLGGRDPKFVTIDYVLDEAVTLIRRRTGSHELAVKMIEMIKDSEWVRLEFVDEEVVKKAISKYVEFEDKELSFTDWVSAVQIDEMGYDGIISFDSDFDGIGLDRIC